MLSPVAAGNAKKSWPAIPRAPRWIFAATLPLLLFSILALSLQNWSAVKAAGPVNVGNCTGAQDFATIQAAVDAADPDTIINICPKAGSAPYAESVNLSRMATVGNITLRKMPNQAGTVNINPIAGSGIWITTTSYFTGNITLEGITVNASDGDGIYLGMRGGGVLGIVLISNVQSLDNERAGLAVYTSDVLTIQESRFDNNTEQGVFARSERSIEIKNVQANDNGTEDQPSGYANGLELSRSDFLVACSVEEAADTYFLKITDTIANGNSGRGILYDASVNTTISGTEVNNNLLEGLYGSMYGDDCTGIPSFEMTGSTAEGNGFVQFTAADDIGIATYREFGGFRVYNIGPINVSNSVASANAGFGFCLYSDSSTTTGNSNATNNEGDGFLYTSGCSRDVLPTSLGELSVAKSTIQHDEIGIQNGLQTVVITNSTANANEGNGFGFDTPYAAVTLTQVSATGNLTGVAFSTVETFSQVGSADEVSVADALSEGTTSIANSLIQNNTVHGLYYGQPMLQYAALAPTPSITSTNVVASSIICENGVGLRAEQFTPLLRGFSANVSLISYTLNVDARGNWWGDELGPDAPGNNNDDGDSIQIAVAEPPTNTVQVLYNPWIDTILSTAAPNPSIVNLPVNMEVQFLSDSTPTYYLENGVGDPNNGPLFTFAVTSPSGVLNSTPQQFIVNRLLSATATPTLPDTMTVQLTGPCGLVATENILIASVSMTKTVYVDGYREVLDVEELIFHDSDCAMKPSITVPVNTTVKYCYTITNTGEYPLSTYSLVDNKFPNPILNNLPKELGPGQSFSTIDEGINITQTLNVNITNVATVTAQMDVPDVKVGVNTVDATISVVSSAQATVSISPDDLDQDGDGIPDNVEGSGDTNSNGIPNYLDPNNPTSEPPTEQPQDNAEIFLPSLGKND